MSITRSEFEDFIILYLIEAQEYAKAQAALKSTTSDDSQMTYFEEFTSVPALRNIKKYHYRVPQLSKFKYNQWKKRMSVPDRVGSVWLEIKS